VSEQGTELSRALAREAAARTNFEKLEASIREEKRRAEAAINEKHGAALAEARAAVSEAEANVRAAKDRLPEHPWAGKRVYRMEPQTNYWGRRIAEKRVEGVVETMRSCTPIPANTPDWKRPRLGDGFVRFLKADGSPGSRFEPVHNWAAWKLAESTENGSTPKSLESQVGKLG